MTKYELREITHDPWDDKLWGRLSSSNSQQLKVSVSEQEIGSTKLYFYWGDNDHWVDNKTRDGVIAARAKRIEHFDDEAKPHMEIDTLGVPHAFCISE